MPLTPKRSSESATEMVQVVLPNDANPLGFILPSHKLAIILSKLKFSTDAMQHGIFITARTAIV